nr:hypothetical protein [Myxococcota bacterium]
EPTYLAVKLFSNRHVERVRRQVANWHERFPHIYAPVLLPLADGDLLVVLERFDSQQSAAAARRAFELALEPASAAPRVGGS